MKEPTYDEYVDIQIKAHKRRDVDALTIIKVVNGFFHVYEMSRDVRILDLGCGEGVLLSIFKSKGYNNCYGIELNKEKVAFANSRRSSLKIVYGDMHEEAPFEGKFDLVTMHHTLEHTLYPKKALEAARNKVTDSGYVWIIVPFEPHNTEEYGRGNAHTHPYSSLKQVRNEIEEVFDIVHLRQERIREPEVNILCTKKR